MKYNAYVTFKYVLKFLILLSIFSIALILVTRIIDNRRINEIKKYTEENTKVLYISDKDNYLKDPVDLFNKYDIDYKYINIKSWSKFEKEKLQTLLDEKNLSNTIIIFKDGRKVDSLVNYKSKFDLIEFFQKYHLVPQIIGNNENILSSVEKYINEDYMILYVPYEYGDFVEEQNSILSKISDDNDIKYKLISAYLLSDSQKESLNNLLQISNVKNQIVILIRKGKIYYSIRNVYTKDEYLEEMNKCGFINNFNSIPNIDYSKFEQLTSNDQKSIVFIETENCKECESAKNILSKIYNVDEINAYILNVEDLQSYIANKVEARLISMGYSNAFAVPLVVIVESNKVLDYVIGVSNEDYFESIFIENGILKR